ncbi:MAG: FtsX-like permease family protein [Chrysiogenales bacterium]|nr:MAG: FtsX-like permease family protein [Chrysiogenales bacterium]
MWLICTIAWRNIQRHRGKSMVIGIILFLGALIMTIGNGVISGMEKGLRDNIMNRFTGQIVIISANQIMENVIFTPLGKDVEVITGYDTIKKVLDGCDYIARFMPVAKGLTLILNENGDVGYSLALGVKFDDYQKMFLNNVQLVDGEFLKNDNRGILISEGNRTRIYDEQGFWLVPRGHGVDEKNLPPDGLKNRDSLDVRERIVVMGGSMENTSRDLEIEVKGIIKYEYLDEYWKNFNIMDIESFREVYQYVTAADSLVEIPAEKKKLLETDNLDNIFGDTLVEKTETKGKRYDITSLIGKKVVQKRLDVDSGAYNLVFIKLKDAERIGKSLDDLNAKLKAAGAEARAISWKEAVGQIADTAMIMRGVTTGFVVLIFFVAIIIIMNTLSMTALERVSEIGMMRAVGAQKSFIAKMFFAETAMISFVFGGAGILAGTAVVVLLNLMNITTDNNVLVLLFGGKVFRPALDLVDILVGVVELVVVTVIAILYPLRVARGITPLDAIMRD